MTLEVCVSTLADVRNAIDGGADRLELCAALDTGGITPSAGLINTAISMAHGSIPVNVLIRQREGDFVYCRDEVRAMLADIAMCSRLGASGVVVGALTAHGMLDTDIISMLVDEAHKHRLTATLSRAIDLTPDPVAAVAHAIECGCDRILTSGGMPTALDGSDTLTRMHHAAAGRTLIMAGSGINDTNLQLLISRACVDEVHGSFRSHQLYGHTSRQLPGLDGRIRHTSATSVANAKKIIDTNNGSAKNNP